MTISIAVVGSGPSGFYAIEALLKKLPDCRVDLIDRIPAPFGLVRYGVAPDHEKTRNVTRAYRRVFDKGDVRYYGNVDLGRDIALDDLRGAYDAVVLATGASGDRIIAIPGSNLPQVYGAASFVGWYNGHPDHVDLAPDIACRAIAVIGNGNVALDVARILSKSRAELAATDIAPHALEAIDAAAIETVWICGRRGPIEGSFTKPELGEMGDLARAVALVRRDQLPDAMPPLAGTPYDSRSYNMRRANLDILRRFAGNRPGEKPGQVRFEFFASPRAILGKDRVSGLRLERTRLQNGKAVGTGETFDIDVGCVISSIGYKGLPIDGAPYDEWKGTIPNKEGHVDGTLYVVGWAKRGPSGTIPTNRKDSFAVVDQLVAGVADGGRPGRRWLDACLAEKGIRRTTFDDWLTIEAAEIAAATPPAPRRRFTTIEGMLSVLPPNG